jgi:hypothetical protein
VYKRQVKNIVKSPFVNEAFFTLNDDLKRASYILKLKGVKPDRVEYVLPDDLKENLKNTYILPIIKEEVEEQLEIVKNEFATSVDYDELLNAKKHYTILYKLIRLDKEIYDRINE